MKSRITAFLLLFIPLNILPQELPVGVFSAGLEENLQNEYFKEIKDLGVNWVIHRPTKSNIKALNDSDLDLIVLDGATADNTVYYYSGGYYSRWEAEEKPRQPGQSGIKRGANGELIRTDGRMVWASKSNVQTMKFLSGPNYLQNQKYRMFYIKNPVISYTASVNMKIEGAPASSSEKVCEITFEYVFDHVKKDGKVSVDKIILGKKIINLNDRGIGKFTDYSVTYNLQQAVERTKAKEANKLAGFNDTKGTYGLNIVVDYYGQRKIYIDYIEVYDTEIGIKIRNNPKQVEKEILSFVGKHANLKNVKFFYGLDEPQSIDNYFPFKFVNNVLKKNGKAPLITTFYPYWTGTMNGDITFERFTNIAQPDQLMFYYYPVLRKRWPDPNSSKGSFPLYDTLRKLLQSAHEANPDFFSMVQCHAFQDKSISDNLWLRQPSPEELNAQVLLALAHGAKGIFFYNLFSNYSHDALLDKNNKPTPLYRSISKEIAPRLRGKFGSAFLNLKYDGHYLQYNSAGAKITRAKYLSVADTRLKGEFNYHAGLLTDKKDNTIKYFLIVNLLSSQKNNSNPLKLNVRNDLMNKYKNMRLRDIEGGLDVTINNSYSLNFDQGGGDGRLYQMAPVVKYGGKLQYNETINGTEDLLEPMEIDAGIELTVNGVYNVYQNITVKPGGKLNTAKSGKINYFNGAKIIDR